MKLYTKIVKGPALLSVAHDKCCALRLLKLQNMFFVLNIISYTGIAQKSISLMLVPR